jgi:hypothetical protein
MPAAIDVHPQKWADDLTVLFDNGTYSVVSGTYHDDDGDIHALGERWNGNDGHPGFPNQGGNSIFHVVPNFLAVSVLHGLLDELSRRPSANRNEFMERIIHELETQHGGTLAAAA